MPTSGYTQIGKTIEVLLLLQPRSILDIGIGNGKYGFLAREYLELWNRGYDSEPRRIAINGVEGFRPYIGEVQRAIYDNIIVGDALSATRTMTPGYDLVLLIDVLEHFDRLQGKELLAQCVRLGRNVLVSTPKRVERQGSEFENALEVHRSQWSPSEIAPRRGRLVIGERSSHLILVGEDAKRVGRWLLYRRVERVSWLLAQAGVRLFRLGRLVARHARRKHS
jgi:hypothetical protein